MPCMKRLLLALSLLAVAFVSPIAFGNIIFVAPEARGAGDGSGWADAADLHTALDDLAKDGDELWLERGDYRPTGGIVAAPTPEDAEKVFRVRHSLILRGGFHGVEASLEEREMVAPGSGLTFSTFTGDLADDDLPPTDQFPLDHFVGINAKSLLRIEDGTDVFLERFYFMGTFGRSAVVANGGSTTLRMEWCFFVRNRSLDHVAPALDFSGSELILDRCGFEWNQSARDGGAMSFVSLSTGASGHISRTSFRNNRAVAWGGAVVAFSIGGHLVFEDCNFHRNHGGSLGGAINARGVSSSDLSALILRNNRFENNTSGSVGGAVYALYLEVTSRRNTYTGNAGTRGGGLFAERATARVVEDYFSGNQASEKGGAIQIGSGASGETHLHMVNTAFIANRAQVEGGALAMREGTQVYAFGCEFARNSGGARGGAIAAEISAGAPIVLDHCGFRANFAADTGGAIWTAGCGGTVTNSLFWKNPVTGLGEDLTDALAGGGSWDVSHSLVQGGWSGTGNVDADPLWIYPDDSAGDDGIWGTPDDVWGFNAVRADSPLVNGSNGLLPLDLDDLDENGVTAETLPLDLRGLPRVFGERADIGPWEFHSFPAYVYVDAQATGAGNGRDWPDAFTSIPAARAALGPGTGLLLAGGTYRVSDDPEGDDQALIVFPGMLVQGGFAGNTPDPIGPFNYDPQLYRTLLTGDLANDDGDLLDGMGQTPVITGINSRNLIRLMPGIHRVQNSDPYSDPSQITIRGLHLTRSSGTAIRGAPDSPRLYLGDCVFSGHQGYRIGNPEDPFDEANQPAILLYSGPALTLSGVQIHHSIGGQGLRPEEATGPADGIVVRDTAHVNVHEVHVFSSGQYGRSVLSLADASATVRNTRFTDLRGAAIEASGPGRLLVGDSGFFRNDPDDRGLIVLREGIESDFTQCVFAGHGMGDFDSEGPLQPPLFHVDGGSTALFIFSTFYENGDPANAQPSSFVDDLPVGSLPVFLVENGSVTLRNTLVQHHESLVALVKQGSFESAHSLIDRAPNAALPPVLGHVGTHLHFDAGTRFAPAGLIDPLGPDGIAGTADDFPVPGPLSAAVDGGQWGQLDPNGLMNPLDFRGNWRFTDGRGDGQVVPDIGAYEYTPMSVLANTGLALHAGEGAPVDPSTLLVDAKVPDAETRFRLLPANDLPGAFVHTGTDSAVTQFGQDDLQNGLIRFESFHDADASATATFWVEGGGDRDPILLSMSLSLLQRPVLHVTADGTGDGSSWEGAANLIDALEIHAPALGVPVDIWVATGLHRPSLTGDVNAFFRPHNSWRLFGGFLGHESKPEQRDWRAHPTVLTGDLDLDDDTWLPDDPAAQIRGANSHTVLLLEGSDRSNLVDGFFITAGDAGDPLGAALQRNGGGIALFNTSATLRNLRVQGNRAAQSGGGLFMENARPGLREVDFRHNTAANGGAIAAVASAPRIAFGRFDGNHAQNGGALHLSGTHGSTPAALGSVRFFRNVAVNGGGLYLSGNPASVQNGFFYENEAAFGAGAYLTGAGVVPEWSFLTMVDNHASTAGGAIYHTHNARLQIYNSILWDNTAAIDSPAGSDLFTLAHDPATPPAFVADTILEGGYPNSSGLLDTDPRLIRDPGRDGLPLTGDDIYLPAYNSPALDAALYRPHDYADLDGDFDRLEPLPLGSRPGVPRALPGTPFLINAGQTLADLGAFERRGAPVWELQQRERDPTFHLQPGFPKGQADFDNNGIDDWPAYAFGHDPLLGRLAPAPRLFLSGGQFFAELDLPAGRDDVSYSVHAGDALGGLPVQAPEDHFFLIEPLFPPTYAHPEVPETRLLHLHRFDGAPLLFLQLGAEYR